MNSSSFTILGALAISLTMSMPGARAETPLQFGWSSVTPHAADFTGDGRMELGLYDSLNGTVYVRQLNGEELAFGLTMALSDYQAAYADYDGDGCADLGSYDRSNGVWYAWMSAREYKLASLPCAVGLSTTMPKPADYDGDGKADPALYDSSLGLWVIYLSTTGYQPVSFNHLSGEGCQAVPMDYDGDGKADPAVYDQDSGLWAVNFSSSDYALNTLAYGGPGCAAAPEDFDGDGKADLAVYCAALGVWGTLYSSSNYAPSVILQGGPNCLPVPAKYYFTNRADHAVYNTTNGCWYIAYNPVGGIFSGIGSKFFDGIISGAGREVGGDILGWSLKKIFHHGENPSDPNWAEEQAALSEMNQKLDQLLADQQVITNMLVQLSAQLEYDKNEIEFLIKQSAADNAISIIESHYDQHGIDGYRSFYECNTNNPPSCADVDYFVNVVLGSTYNIKTAVNNVYRAIIPALNSTNGVLRSWAAMAKPTLTPDNLLDNFNALAYYFATMYNYQMKGASMYVDASRVHGTSEWAKAATATWITNDLTTMVQQEVDEFRTVTYDLVLTAINAAYNPAKSNSLMTATNVAEVLAPLEFFSYQWQGQTQHLCATFLAVEPTNVISWYAGITARDTNSNYHYAQAVITNWAAGHPYGYWRDSVQTHIAVADRYAFLRYDFGQLPPGRYDIYKDQQGLGSALVTNYDASMQPTGDPSVTNWFGHLYASPTNIQSLFLPLDSSVWMNNIYNDVTYTGANPGHRDVWWNFTGTSSLTNFNMEILLRYDVHGGSHNPSSFGVWPWIYACSFPFSISNTTARPVTARVYITAGTSASSINRWDSHEAFAANYKVQSYAWANCGAIAGFTRDALDKWVWQTGMRKIYNVRDPDHWGAPDYYEATANAHEGMTYSVVSGKATNVTLYVGGQIYLYQDCYEGMPKSGDAFAYAAGQIQMQVKKITVTFY